MVGVGIDAGVGVGVGIGTGIGIAIAMVCDAMLCYAISAVQFALFMHHPPLNP